MSKPYRVIVKNSDNPEYKDSVGFMDNVIYLGLKLKTEKGFLNNEPL